MKTTLRLFSLTLLLIVTFRTQAQPPVAYPVTMPTIVQASNLMPLQAEAFNCELVMFSIETIPAESAGTLYLSMSDGPMAVSAGMMMSADLAGSLIFEPNPVFTGTAVFTYSATDENMEVSNTTTYSIPVIGQQAVILPVQLLGFTGTLQQNMARLFWQTSQETEGCYFELQRSTDGHHFYTIATVSGKGTAGIQEYATTDDVWQITSQQFYYRIRIVEVNGHARYSQQIQLSTTQRGANLKAWPNPFRNQMQVAFQSESDEQVILRITAANGSVVKQISLNARKGNNIYQLQQLDQLPAGHYVLSVHARAQLTHLPIIKK